MAKSKLRQAFSLPGLKELLPGNSIIAPVSTSTLRRWIRRGYIEKRGASYILTRKGYHAA